MVETVLRRLSIVVAVLGGAVVLSVIAMSLVSLLGRKLWSAPIPGDIEILEMAIAVAVASFMPLCELRDNHIRVDLIAGLLPAGVNRVLLSLSHLLLALVAALLIWRTGLLTLDSHEYGSTSTMLAVPLWIPQMLMLPGLALLCACALYQAARSLTSKPLRVPS
ncbi:TRAP transporter small permease [Alloalcanivorax xenomutans]|uniref:TRAP transporter small permease n=1 Tax=Alloalcanivorax xenomutans TaxID=1094342 RepID=UPI000BDA83F2|nr:TRAP transporter small permease [Alloalcanivorax xenomutans]MBA4721153.1 TRAP transporter small permease [Alcanivorax sp.]SOC00481.1 TRAP-type C4-dicarboxylate transport system permease small subunit [Alloalcanivorax xenomutans]